MLRLCNCYDVIAHGGLIIFDNKQVIGLLFFYDITGRIVLSVQHISGYDRTLQGQRLKKFGQFGDFVGFFFDSHWADYQGFLVQKGAEQVDRPLAGIVRSAQCFAISCHSTSGQRAVFHYPIADLGVPQISIQLMLLSRMMLPDGGA